MTEIAMGTPQLTEGAIPSPLIKDGSTESTEPSRQGIAVRMVVTKFQGPDDIHAQKSPNYIPSPGADNAGHRKQNSGPSLLTSVVSTMNAANGSSGNDHEGMTRVSLADFPSRRTSFWIVNVNVFKDSISNVGAVPPPPATIASTAQSIPNSEQETSAYSQASFPQDRFLSSVVEESNNARLSVNSSGKSGGSSRRTSAGQAITRPQSMAPTSRERQGSLPQVSDGIPVGKRSRSISMSLEWITPRGQTWKPPPQWEELSPTSKAAKEKENNSGGGGIATLSAANTPNSGSAVTSPASAIPFNGNSRNSYNFGIINRKERSTTVSVVGAKVITSAMNSSTPVSSAPATPVSGANSPMGSLNSRPSNVCSPMKEDKPRASTSVALPTSGRGSVDSPSVDKDARSSVTTSSATSKTTAMPRRLSGAGSLSRHATLSGNAAAALSSNPLPLSSSRSISTSAMVLTTVTPATPLQASSSFHSLSTSSPSSSPFSTGGKGLALVPLSVRMMKSRSRQGLASEDSGDEMLSSFEDVSSTNSGILSKHCPPMKSSSSTSLTGTKDRRRFPKLFPELAAQSENLVAVYACAWEKDVLLQGKMFLTQSHCAFYCNILGSATTLLISLTDIVTVEKKSTAGMFPNAIRIATAENKYVFSSFIKRDSAFTDIVELWRMSSCVFPVSPGGGPTEIIEHHSLLTKRDSIDQQVLRSGNFEDTSAALSIPHENFKAEGKCNSTTFEHQISTPTAAATVLSEFWVSPPMASGSSGQAALVGDQSLPLQGDGPPGMDAAIQKRRMRSLTSGAYPSSPLNLDVKQAAIKRKELGSNDGHSDSETISTPVMNRSGRSATVGLLKKLLHTDITKCGSASSSQEMIFSHPPPITIPSRPMSNHGPSSAATDGSTHSSPSDSSLPPGASSGPVSPSSPTMMTTAIGGEEESRLHLRSKEAVKCPCESHLEHLISSEVFPMAVGDLFAAIFGHVEKGGSAALIEVHRKKDSEGLKIGKWNLASGTSVGSQATVVSLEGAALPKGSHREIYCGFVFKMPMIQKNASTARYEKQVIISTGELNYTIESTSKTPRVPYGESFQIITRYCLTHEGVNRSRLLITAKVDFVKKLMLKDRIEAASLESVHALSTHLVHTLLLLRPSVSSSSSTQAQVATPVKHLKRLIPTLSRAEISDDGISDVDSRPAMLRRSESMARRSRVDDSPRRKPVSLWTLWWDVLVFLMVAAPFRGFVGWINWGVERVGGGSGLLVVPEWMAKARLPFSIVLAASGRADSLGSSATGGGGNGGGGSGGGGSPTRQRSKSERRRSRHRNSTNDDLNWKAGGSPGAGRGGAGGGSGGGGGGDHHRVPFVGGAGGSLMILGLIVVAVCAGVIVTALNVMWMADIGTRLDRALVAVREAKAAAALGGEVGRVGGVNRVPSSADERQEIEWTRQRSDLAETQNRFTDRSKTSLTSARQAISDASRSSDLLREQLDRLKRSMGATLFDVGGGADRAKQYEMETGVLEENVQRMSEADRKSVIEAVVGRILTQEGLGGDAEVGGGKKGLVGAVGEVDEKLYVSEVKEVESGVGKGEEGEAVVEG
ncbi:hypothetical protein HDU67_002310 [Dinochytrium kinnereticum]|nr:hypothetical protein HDU67_002310 [Dinochytrium kinnereticum]